MENAEQEILSIMWRNIRLVVRPDCADADHPEDVVRMVKPGTLEKAAKEIAEKFNR